jgi:hypothetical protein
MNQKKKLLMGLGGIAIVVVLLFGWQIAKQELARSALDAEQIAYAKTHYEPYAISSGPMVRQAFGAPMLSPPIPVNTMPLMPILGAIPVAISVSMPTSTPMPPMEPDMTLDDPSYKLIFIHDTGNPFFYPGGMIFVAKGDELHGEIIRESQFIQEIIPFGKPQLVAGGVKYQDDYQTNRFWPLTDRGVITGVAHPQQLHFFDRDGRYLADDVQVYYLSANDAAKPWDAEHALISVIPDADPQTFKVLSKEVYLASDAHAYYLNGARITGIDETTMHKIDDSYSIYEDRTALYRFTTDYGTNHDNEKGVMERIDKKILVQQLGSVNSQYTKDSRFVYFAGKVVFNADPHSFVLLAGMLPLLLPKDDYISYDFFARDANHVFYSGALVPDADAGTFRPIENGLHMHTYGKDSTHVFYETKVIEGADPNTFTVLWTPAYEGCSLGHYAKDAHAMYFENTKVEGADPATFVPLINNFGKDDQGIYFKDSFRADLPKTYTPSCDYGVTGGLLFAQLSAMLAS